MIIEFPVTPTVTLIGGGRWFEGSDTGTYYDAVITFTAENPSGISKQCYYEFHLSTKLNDDQPFAYDTADLRSKLGLIRVSDTFDIPAGGSVAINDTFLLDICRKNNDWSSPYILKLVLSQIGGNYLNKGVVVGDRENNRFHGIIYTTEQSPDPIAIFDEPDDGDYTKPSEAAGFLTGIFANPATDRTTIRFTLNTQSQVKLWLARTPATVSSVDIDNEVMQAGFFEVDHFFAEPPGQYRVYLEVVSGSRRDTTYADVIRSID